MDERIAELESWVEDGTIAQNEWDELQELRADREEQEWRNEG